MLINTDLSQQLIEQTADAVSRKAPLHIVAGDSKNFYGRPVHAQKLDLSEHRGIIEYQPSELVITVRSGTRLDELEAELKHNRQMLAFEPPQHSSKTTIGGVVACGLAGPRRVACGGVRDFVLGTTIINGKAEKLRFGGQVMKNVAGYDAARLMAGAQGTLGVLLDISLKVLPLNEQEITLQLSIDLNDAVSNLQQWIKQGLPVSASCYYNNNLYLRLSGCRSAISQSLQTIRKYSSADEIDNGFWTTIRNQTHEFFQQTDRLWRCSHQSTTRFYASPETQLIEWHGALRWIKSGEDLHETAADYHGHATRYALHRGEDADALDIFQPLASPMMNLHKRLKQAFDPDRLLNPGRLYKEL